MNALEGRENKLAANSRSLGPNRPTAACGKGRITSDRGEKVMTYLKLIITYALACLCLVLPSPALFAQETWAADFFEEIEVRTMNVEVFVTDRSGTAVEGLSAQDFEVLDDGQPMKLTNFYVQSKPLAPETEAPSPTLEFGGPLEQQLTVVLFFDQAHLSSRSRDRVLERLRATTWFKPGQRHRLMVICHRSDQSLEVIQELADDPRKLESALQRVTSLPAAGDLLRAETQATLRQLLDLDRAPGLGATDLPTPREIASNLRPVFEAEHLRIRSTLETLERFVDALTILPGRKALVYISDGLALRPGEAVVEAFLGPLAEADLADLDTTALWRQLGDRANANRVTFYPLLANGGRTDDFSYLASGPNFRAEDRTRSARAAAVQKANFRSPMEILAETTGGRAFVQPRSLERALAHLRQDFSSYYSLGYQAPRPADGKTHQIKVRLKGRHRDLQVRHRQAYYDKAPEEAMAARTLSALYFGTQDNNPLGVKLELSPMGKGDAQDYQLTVNVKIPISSLMLLPEETFHEAQVSIFVGARDAAGHTSPIQRMPTPIRIPNNRLLSSLNQMATYPVDLRMPNNAGHTLVVGVRDEFADRESTMRVSVLPGI